MSGATATVMAVAAVAITAAGQIRQGQAAQNAANFEAQQLDVNAKSAEIAAGQNRASAQRAAIEKRREGTLLASRAQAVGSAGGSVLDPSTANIISGIQGEGEYGALTALYQGEEAAYGNEDSARMNLSQAGAKRASGRNAQTQSYYNAAGTAASFFSKYGSSMGDSTSSGVAPERAGNTFAYRNPDAHSSLPWSTAYR